MDKLKINRYDLAMAAARDAGNRSMRAAGRSRWSRADYVVSCQTFNKVFGIRRTDR